MMDENVRLLTLQQQLEQDAGGRVTFTGMSVSETVKACILNGLGKRVDKIKSDFGIPDKRYVFLLQSQSRTISRKVIVSGT
jgi:hypothetical protein